MSTQIDTSHPLFQISPQRVSPEIQHARDIRATEASTAKRIADARQRSTAARHRLATHEAGIAKITEEERELCAATIFEADCDEKAAQADLDLLRATIEAEAAEKAAQADAVQAEREAEAARILAEKRADLAKKRADLAKLEAEPRAEIIRDAAAAIKTLIACDARADILGLQRDRVLNDIYVLERETGEHSTMTEPHYHGWLHIVRDASRTEAKIAERAAETNTHVFTLKKQLAAWVDD